ncbi:MAG: PAS domain S-box protein [Candidatus Zhuqueibacterota bacterium]
MTDNHKSKSQLVAELHTLRQRISDLETRPFPGDSPERRIQHLNRVLRAIRNVNQLITKEKNREALIEKTCATLVETRGFFSAWIVLLNDDQSLVQAAADGLGDEFQTLKQQLAAGSLNECATRALKRRGVVVIENTVNECHGCPLVGKEPGRAMTVRLEFGRRVYGALSVAVPATLATDSEEQLLLHEVADDIGFALHNIDLEQERDMTETALRDSEERFRMLFNSGSDITVVTELKRSGIPGKILDVNDNATKILGYTKEELRQHSPLDFMPLQEKKKYLAISKKLMVEKKAIFETSGYTKSGLLLDFEISAEITRYQGKRLLISVVRDISWRRQAEEKLRASEEKYRDLFQNAPIGIFQTNSRGQALLANDAMAGILGFEEPGAVLEYYQNLGEQLYVSPERRDEFIRLIRENGHVEDFEYEAKLSDGRIVWLRMNARASQKSEDGSFTIQGFTSDVTQRRWVEDAYRDLVDHSLQGIGVLQDGVLVFANRALTQITGYSHEELMAMSPQQMHETVHPEDREWVLKNLTDRMAGRDVSGRSEFRIIRKDGSVRWVEAFATRIERHGKSSLQITYIDITQRKLAEDALRRSEGLLERTQRITKVGGWEWDILQQAMYWTDEAYRIHDYDPAAIEPGDKSHVEASLRCYDPADQPVISQAFERCAREGQSYDLEFPFTTSKGRRLWIRTSARAEYENGRIARVNGMIADITDRRQAELALKESETLLRSVIDAIPVCIYAKDLHGTYIFANQFIADLYGTTPAEIIGKTDLDFAERMSLTQEDAAAFMRDDQEVITRQQIKIVEEEPYTRPDGTVRWFHTTKLPLQLQDNPLCMLGVSKDITERRAMQEKLRQSEERHRHLLESIQDSVYVLDREWRHTLVNEAGVRFTHVPRERLLGNKLTDLFPGVENTPFFETFQRVMNDRRPEVVSTEFTFEDGRSGWYEIYVSPVPEGILCISRDISERMRATEALRQNEEKLRLLFHNINDVFYCIDRSGAVIDMSPSVERILGYEPAALIGKSFPELNILSPDSLRRALADTLQVLSGESISMAEYEFIARDGSRRYGEVSGSPIFVNGEIVAVASVARDITERKWAEESLRESENLFRTLYTNLPGGMVLIDSDYRIKDVNPATCTITGYSRDELVGQLCDIICPKGSLSKKCPIWAQGAAGFEGMDTAMKCKNGYRNPVLKNSRRVLVNGKEHILEVFQDTRPLKEAEHALRTSEEQFRLLAENSVDCIWKMDTSLRFTYLSPALERMFGSKPDEWIGTTLRSHFRKKEYEKIEYLIVRIFSNDPSITNFNFETKMLNNEGEEVDLEVTGKVLLDDDGQLIGLQGTTRHIAERKIAEARLGYRFDLERLIADISSRLVGMESSELDAEIRYILKRIGKFTQTDRISLYRFNNDYSMASRTHEWRARGVRAQKEHMQNLPAAHFPLWSKKLQQFETICIPSVSEMPEEACAEKDFLQSLGEKSLLVVPLVYGSELLGFMTFNSYQKERTWSDEDKALIRTIGEILAAKLVNRRVEKEKAKLFHDMGERLKEMNLMFQVSQFKVEPNATLGEFLQKTVNSIPTAWQFSEIACARIALNGKEYATENFKATRWCQAAPILLHGEKAGMLQVCYLEKRPDEFEGPFLREERYLIESIAQQITTFAERNTSEIELRDSEEKFRTITEQMADMVFLTDALGHLSYVSPASEQIFGYPFGAMNGHPFMEFLVDSEIPKAIAAFQTSLSTRSEVRNLELLMKRADGSVFTGELNARVYIKGDFVGTIGLIRDITERKRSVEALRESEQRYKDFIQNSPLGVFVSDENGRYIQVNPSASKITGYSETELLTMGIADFVSEDMMEQGMKHFQTVIHEGKAYGELRFRHKSGELRWWVISAVKLSDTRFLAFCDDSTERKKNEEERTNLEAQLRRSQKMETIGTLAGGIAHDFNNILTPIMGYTDMAISQLSLDHPLREDLKLVLRGAHRAKDLVQQILTFSRQIEQERKPLHLHLIVKEAIQLLRPSIPSTIQIRQRIRSTCDPVLADASQIHQVIMNLCTNGYQSMEEKGGVLTIELKQVHLDAEAVKHSVNLKQKDYAVLTIADTGIGMDGATLERIFDPFFTTKAVDKGTGLGLAVVHGIVRSHHGDVFVESEPGKGSSFRVYLPVVQEKIALDIPAPGEKMHTGHETILVVDDEEIVASVVRKMLEQYGYCVEVFLNSRDALHAFQKQPDKYDLVISDLTMPSFTGLDLANHVHQSRPDMPFVLMTGYGENLSEDILKHYCIAAIVGKPIEMKMLNELVRKTIDSHSRGDE